jgi:hypothetical protein
MFDEMSVAKQVQDLAMREGPKRMLRFCANRDELLPLDKEDFLLNRKKIRGRKG